MGVGEGVQGLRLLGSEGVQLIEGKARGEVSTCLQAGQLRGGVDEAAGGVS